MKSNDVSCNTCGIENKEDNILCDNCGSSFVSDVNNIECLTSYNSRLFNGIKGRIYTLLIISMFSPLLIVSVLFSIAWVVLNDVNERIDRIFMAVYKILLSLSAVILLVVYNMALR